MSTIQTQRAQVLAEAVVSAYIHELATPDRPVQRPARRSRAVAAAARARRALSRLEPPQLLRVADRVDAGDATVGDDERDRRALAVAAWEEEPEPPVELDLGRFANELAAERGPGASDPRCAA
jgi:hypothetical protein